VGGSISLTMNSDQELSAAFEAHREHLNRVAYAMLGSMSDAEDVVQNAWLRLQRRSEPAEIEDLRAWLTTTVSRLSLDALGSARARREHYVGPWLPEPKVEELADNDPAERVTLDESISLALLIVMEHLSPPERTAFLLHDIFGFTFAEVAETVGRSPAAVRQLATRARKQVASGRPRFPATHTEQVAIVSAFARACSEGDIKTLARLLHPEVVWRTDGGGRVKASRQVLRGARTVARSMLALARRPPQAGRMVAINSSPGLLLRDTDGVLTVISLTVDSGLIVAIDIMRNPHKLRRVEPQL